MKKIKTCILSAFLLSLSASVFSQSQSSVQAMLNSRNSVSAEALKKSATGEKEVASDVTKLPDAQLAMSVSYYPVTAGDVYTLAFAAGTTAVHYTIPVDSTYKIRVANMGVINCAGLTYLQLKSQVEALVLRNYPMGGVQFVLSSPSTFLVSITGEVIETAERNAWALTRLSTFIKMNFTPFSSQRDITVVSANGKTVNYDLFLAMRDGDLSQDPFLRPGDKIVVNRIKRLVELKGAVERPGKYELKDGENLKELIERYGSGLIQLADTSRIELYRSLTGEDGSGKTTYLNQSDIEANKELMCFDAITVHSYEELYPTVFLEGAVEDLSLSEQLDTSEKLDSANKLSVSFTNGEDYAYFARRNKKLFSNISDLANAYVIREGKTYPLDLNPMLYDASYYANFEMKPNDTLVIPFRQYFVSVAGSVANPGRYPYIPDRTWDYYVGLAGGFIKSQNSRSAVTIIDINGKKLSKKDFITPECTVTAKTNSLLYYFNQYASPIVTLLSIVASTISIMAATGNL